MLRLVNVSSSTCVVVIASSKVARKLKYFSPETDYAALERELVSASSGADPRDEYEELAAKYNVDDDDDWEDSDVPQTEPGRRS